MADLPRVAVILTGGTIDSVGANRLDLAWYIEAGKRLKDGELLERVPEITAIAQIEEVPFRRLPSHALVDKDWIDLVAKIHEIFDSNRADGIVITHGTNTLEETAYFLSLTVKRDRPVVIAGAMRPSSAVSADGYLNLLNAVRVAADPQTVGKGCVVVMNDTIYAGRDVTKTATYRVQTFQGRDLGPLGYADADGKVIYYHVHNKPHTTQTEFDVTGLESLPRADVVVSYVGADGVVIDALVAAGTKAIVSAGTGAGRPTPSEDEALTRAHEKGVVICQSSRVGSGRTVYAPALQRRGFVAADNLVPWKARLLMQLALTKTTDPVEIQRMVDTY